MRAADLIVGCPYRVNDPRDWTPLGKVKLLSIEKVGEDRLGRPLRKGKVEVLAALADWRPKGAVMTLPISALSIWDDTDEVRLLLTNAINEGGRASVTLERHNWELLLGQLDCQEGYGW